MGNLSNTLPPLGEGARRAEEGRSAKHEVFGSVNVASKDLARLGPHPALRATFSQREKGGVGVCP